MLESSETIAKQHLMSAIELMDGLKREGDAFVTSDGGGWMQGRTMFGGASSLIAYTAAIRTFPDLPPLRAAQIGFIGPIGAESTATARILRQGRNITQVETNIHSGGALAHRGLWLFGAAREANAEYPAALPDPAPLPLGQGARIEMGSGAPSFLQQFEICRAQEETGPGDALVRRWVRLKHREGLDPMAELILLGDAMPPGSMRKMKRQGPNSSINWSFNVLDTAPQTADGWWLAEARGEHAAEGLSSERLQLWNADQKAIMISLQCAAIFG